MEGKVLGFNEINGIGLILGEDKERYSFSTDDWKSEGNPVVGQKADFVAKNGAALEIYTLNSSTVGGIKSQSQQIIENEKTGPTIVYVCYLLSFAMGISLVIGGVFAYVKKEGAPEWIKSHYKYQIRTFWTVLIGGVIGFLTFILGIGVIILGVVYVWLIYRIIKGWVRLSKGEAI